MDSFFDYKILDIIHNGMTCKVYRGINPLDLDLVILKLMSRFSSDDPSREQPAVHKLKHEYKILNTIKKPGICIPVKFVADENCSALITKDIGGVSLNHLHQSSMGSKRNFLNLAINITDAIIEIHKKEILHNRLSLSNIIFNPETSQLNIIDFGSATPFGTSYDSKDTLLALKNQWFYISPEMTGRTSHSLDSRSDIYSLGIIFYRLICGRFPFEASDPAELAHAHLALPPIPIKQGTKNCSPFLSDIIMKLLEKSPDKRYQSAKGLLEDLNICLGQAVGPSFETTKLGHKDFSPQFAIPNRLYGRNMQYKKILNAWGKLDKGKQIVSVSGPAGAGKTALIKKIDTPKFRQNAFFLYGKFDQTGSHVPYQAIADAFKMMINWILSQEQSLFERWKQLLQKALPENGQLIIDIIPDLEKIIGPQPDVVPLSPVSEKNRFNYVIHEFIKTFITADRPILLFVDDIQWADPASMNIIESMCLSSDLHHLLIVGAFRDNEMERGHPWQGTIEKIKEKRIQLHQISLQPLSKTQICSLLSQTLNLPEQSVSLLGETILKKTSGNPLFIHEFLHSIFKKKYIWCNPDTPCWQFDLNQITALTVSNNVAVLILDRISTFDHQSLVILYNAACIGNQFDQQTLTIGSGIGIDEIDAILTRALHSGIIIPITMPTPGSNSPQNKYYFAHDSIQKALLQVFPEKDQIQHQWLFAWRIVTVFSKKIPSDNLFSITSMLNKACDYTRKADELEILAGLNQDSGAKALELAAYETSLQYFQKGIDALEKALKVHKNKISIWEIDEFLCLSLYQGASQSAFLLGQYDEMDNYIQRVEQHIIDPIQKTKLYEIKTSSLYARNKMDEAIDAALFFADALGVTFPQRPNDFHIILGLLQTRVRLWKTNIKDLEYLPKMTEPRILSALNVLSCATLAAFYARPKLLPLIIFKSIELSLKYGNTGASVFGYAGYGFILCGILNKIDLGNQFGNLSLDLVKKFNLKDIETRTTATVRGFITHWKTHLNQTKEHFLEARKTGLETGDHQFACVCMTSYCTMGFHSGENLNILFKDMNTFRKQIDSLNQDVVLNALNIFMQTVSNLKNTVDQPWKLAGIIYNIDDNTLRMETSNDHLGLFTQNYLSLMLCLYFDHKKMAVQFADRAWENYETVRSMPESAFFLFYDSLARLSLCGSKNFRFKKKYIKRIKANQKELKLWANAAPMNIQHKFDLVQAKIHEFFNRGKRAAACFESAIDLAGQNGYLNDQALASELAGRYYLSIHNKDLAAKKLSLAQELYYKWGATAKVKQLEKVYPPFLFDLSSKKKTHMGVKPGIQNIVQALDDNIIAAYQPDLHTILKASQAIAKETDLSIIMKKLISLIMEHSGARKAAIFLYSESVLKLETFAAADTGKTKVLQGIAFDEKDKNLPCSVIQYVRRTDQTIILENAAQSEQFSIDSYIRQRRCKSILCTPIFNKNMIAGILLLENDLLEGSFSKDRLKILEIILSQAVVTIENSKLYENLNKEKKQKNDAVKEIFFHKKILKNMSAELTMVEERERKSIADDLHDSITQTLALSILNLKKLSSTFGKKEKDQVDTVQDYLNQVLTEIRSLTFQLSPKLLYDFGLAAALEWLVDDLRERYKLEVVFINQIEEDPIELSEIENITLYRSTRELLINIFKHAKTHLAFVTLNKDNDNLTLTVKDKGKGIDSLNNRPVAKSKGGYGLYRIHERILALNGQILIKSGLDKGTEITIQLPLQKTHEILNE